MRQENLSPVRKKRTCMVREHEKREMGGGKKRYMGTNKSGEARMRRETTEKHERTVSA